MKFSKLYLIFFSLLLCSCSSKKNFTYLNASLNKKEWNINKLINSSNNIQKGDILKIDIKSSLPEATKIYNNNKEIQSSIEILKLDGYLVDENGYIKYPVLGKVKVINMSLIDLENHLKNLLIDGEHLKNVIVNIRILNSKFTVLGEVRLPGTYNFFDKINILQALGYAGDLTIDGKKNNIVLIRKNKDISKVERIDLTNFDFMSSEYYYIRNNDIIIVNPTYNKVKSAGFIGSPTSISSIASLVLSITLLLLNN